MSSTFSSKTRSSGSQSNNKPPHEKKRRIDSTESIETDSSSEALETYTFTHNELQQFVKRVQIAFLAPIKKKLGLKNDQQLAAFIGCSRSSVARWKNADLHVDSLYTFMGHTGGRPVTKSSEDWTVKILEDSQKNDNFSPRKFAQTYQNQNGPSRTTVRRVLKSHNKFPYKKQKIGRLYDFHMAARAMWGGKVGRLPLKWWKSLLVTDSKIFRLDGGANQQNDRTWLTQEERKTADLTRAKDKFPTSIHVYGGISARGLTKLVLIERNVNADVYIRQILPTLLKQHQSRTEVTGTVIQRKLFEDPTAFIFEQDHASSHDAGRTQRYLSENAPDFLDRDQTPAKMDDIWGIERIWGYMVMKVFQNPRPTNKVELISKVFLEWEKIPIAMLKPLVHGMRARVRKMVEIDGKKLTNKAGCQCLCQECKKYRLGKKKKN